MDIGGRPFCVVLSFVLVLVVVFGLMLVTDLTVERVVESCAVDTKILQVTGAFEIMGVPNRVFRGSIMDKGWQGEQFDVSQSCGSAPIAKKGRGDEEEDEACSCHELSKLLMA